MLLYLKETNQNRISFRITIYRNTFYLHNYLILFREYDSLPNEMDPSSS